MEIRSRWAHENENDWINACNFLFSRGSVFRCRSPDGHLEVERGQIENHTRDAEIHDRDLQEHNDRTLNLTVKKGGNVTVTGRAVISADGKSRTVNVSGTTPKGKKFKNTAVYDKS